MQHLLLVHADDDAVVHLEPLIAQLDEGDVCQGRHAARLRGQERGGRRVAGGRVKCVLLGFVKKILDKALIIDELRETPFVNVSTIKEKPYVDWGGGLYIDIA